MSNAELIAEIQARVDAATKGPWVTCGIYVETVPEFALDRFDIMPETVAKADVGDHDAEFIAHARQDIPNLLAALEKSEAEVVRLGGVIAEARRHARFTVLLFGSSTAGFEMGANAYATASLEILNCATVSAEEGAK